MVTKPSTNSEQREVERTRTDAWLGMERAESFTTPRQGREVVCFRLGLTP